MLLPKSALKKSTFFKKIKKPDKKKINMKASGFKNANEKAVNIASISGRIKYLYPVKSNMPYIS
jgi:hypothetical protein